MKVTFMGAVLLVLNLSQFVVPVHGADPTSGSPPSYTRDIKPILEKSCVICHSCYDAPCQLKMETPEGLERGASKAPVYATRVKAQPPSRMFVDSASTADWRARGFYSVLEGGSQSLLARMLELGARQANKVDEPVPPSVLMGLARQNQCPMPQEFDSYQHRRLHEGMPFGMAPLEPAALQTLRKWLSQGAPLDGFGDPIADGATSSIEQWEQFLNRSGYRNRLLSRYLYEHLFLAHLHFDRAATAGFFEVVRSATPPGQPIEVIATRRPTDDAGKSFYYRIRPVRGSIVQKNHIPYDAGPEKLSRIQKVFDSRPWEATELPQSPRNGCTNPFQAYEAIPASMRYQFLLDDAHFFVQCFIRGPVCLGQVATDVIDDHFYAIFQSPATDLFLSDAAYAKKQTEDLSLDGREGFTVGVMPNWMRTEGRYSKRRLERYQGQDHPGLDALWNGDGTNSNALLTVFRNFDNATVVRGLRGRTPKTIWVLDYPILERIYYLLVANFDVFGNATHQVGTRLYFDLLRAESEVNFLRWMPRETRRAMHSSWYRGAVAGLKSIAVYPTIDELSESMVPRGSGDPKDDFVAHLRSTMPSIAGARDDLEGATSAATERRLDTPVRHRVEAALRPLSLGTGASSPFLKNLPEASFVRVVVDGQQGDLAYSLLRAKSHRSVAFMFREEARLEPDNDYLSLLRGPVGCYPNFVFRVPVDKVAEFARSLSEAESSEDFAAVVARFGVRRTHPSFWDDFQFFWNYQKALDPLEAGILDANRYANF